MKSTTGHLAEKNGKWYAVINLYTKEGKRKEKWHGLDLSSAPGTKSGGEGKIYTGGCISSEGGLICGYGEKTHFF